MSLCNASRRRAKRRIRHCTTDEYKTKKLVLRKIPAGTYWIGGPENASTNIGSEPNSYHSTIVSKDYYAGIFELTVAQYEKIVNGKDNASKLPLPQMTYQELRGNAGAGAVPGSGIFATLNSKTKMTGFDLPTQSMFEIAARAGQTGKWLSGNSVNGLVNYAWIKDNAGGAAHEVGTKLPNNWGLYDTTGNMWELCRDVHNRADLATLQPFALKPIISGTAAESALQSGGSNYGTDTDWCRLAMRHYWRTTSRLDLVGARIFFVSVD